MRRARIGGGDWMDTTPAAGAIVQARRASGDGPGTCLGLSLRLRRGTENQPGRDRARRMVRARNHYALDCRKTVRIREQFSDYLGALPTTKWMRGKRMTGRWMTEKWMIENG